MAVRKKLEPSPKYYNDLEDQLATAEAELETWQYTLYQHVATFTPFHFDNAKNECIKWTKEIKVIQKEMARVKKLL